MCGIAGFIGQGDQRLLERMTNAQLHRGPDDGGTWRRSQESGPRVGLGSRRLSIIDRSERGHMPMASEDGQVVLTYNGEVYNHAELRSRLQSLGHRFRSETDTEVVLRSYLEYGESFVAQLNGMFAFAIWDERKQQLFLARDQFGIKPLYYSQSGASFGFASEIKSLLALPYVDRTLDNRSLSQYLSFLWVPEPRTVFDSIHKLPAGCTATFHNERLTIRRYWDLAFPDADHRYLLSDAEIVEQTRSRFYSAVQSQMQSDVAIGAFLSAGLDSSSIVAAMSAVSQSPVNTFTVTFPESYRKGEIYLDDTAVAARTAKHFGCRHRELVAEADVVDLLPRLVYHMDEPVADPAIISAFLVNRAAKEHATVLLSGIGGDELFAGYKKHRAHYLAAQYRRIPLALRAGLIEPMVRALPPMRGTSAKGYVRLAKKMVRSASLRPEDRFIMDSVYLAEDQKALLCRDWIDSLGDYDPREGHLRLFERVPDADFLNRMLYLDSVAFMPGLNLLYNDKMSMACSVEVRVPFLDTQFAEWTASNVPPGMKLRGATGKHVLREAMRGILPDEVLSQKKAAFGAPIDYWLANDLQEMVDDLLSTSRVRDRGLFEPAVVTKLVNDHRSGKQDWSSQIWQMLTLELWQQEFVDDAMRLAA